ncbi:ABC transporter substrate-binding protein [Paenibacillus soyae]|uniref:ABC transporter substrate-binding protein n=1 Tax=Paenibacillus soyae TaxID=2969249 RepID=A0A9X2MR13_9BACL|nr:ABC transporter substrate-binding protein [Paenibacillus soyae]MCR2804273.1 ABC transporter substrate-binding protein [Paenibacillus soyae]
MKGNDYTRGWIALCALFMLFALSGCGAAGEAVDMSASKKERSEPVVLRYSSFQMDSGSAYFEWIAEFERHNPDIKIDVDYIENANYMTGLKMRLLGGERMDVFDVWSSSLFEEVRRIEPNAYLDISGSPFLDDFHPASLAPVTIGGKVYGVPGLMHTSGLIYNKSMFERLGLEVPVSWDEFLIVCEELRSRGIVPVALNSEWWVPQFLFGSMMSNNGADAAWTDKLESGEARANDPILIDAMMKTKEIIDRGYVPSDWQRNKHEQSKEMLFRGEAAMIVTGTWDLPNVISRSPDQKFEFMMVPGEDRTVPNLNIGSYKVISSGTDHPEEAKRFLAFMNGREMQQQGARTMLAVPSAKDAIVDEPIVDKISSFVLRRDAVIYWPHTISTESLQVAILEQVNAYLAGQDLESTLSAIQDEVDRDRVAR